MSRQGTAVVPARGAIGEVPRAPDVTASRMGQEVTQIARQVRRSKSDGIRLAVHLKQQPHPQGCRSTSVLSAAVAVCMVRFNAIPITGANRRQTPLDRTATSCSTRVPSPAATKTNSWYMSAIAVALYSL